MYDTSDQFIQPLTYRVQFETNGGVDHIDTIFSNQVGYLGLFLVGKLYNLVAIQGCPGIFTLTHATNKCRCSILDYQHW